MSSKRGRRKYTYYISERKGHSGHGTLAHTVLTKATALYIFIIHQLINKLMRKLFTVLAAMMLAVVAYAQTPFVTWPDTDSPVPELDGLTLKGTTNSNGFTVKDASLITVTKGGADFSGVTATDGFRGRVEVSLNTPATAAGEYTITFPAGSLNSYATSETLTEDIVVNYTVDPQASPVQVTSPATTTGLEELTNFTIQSRNRADIKVNDNAEVEVKYNDEFFTSVSVVLQSGNQINFKLDQKAVQPGTYTVVFSDGSVRYADTGKSLNGFTLTFTIEGDEPTPAGPVYTADPADGTTLTTLTQITFAPVEPYTVFDIQSRDEIEVKKDGVYFCGINRGYNETIVLSTPATEAGTYTVILPENSWMVFNDTGYSTSRIELTYTVTGQTEEVFPVTADPENGSIVNELASVKINVVKEDDDLTVNDRSAIKVTKDGEDFTTIKSVRHTYPGATLTLDTPATEKGEYKIIVPKGAIAYNDGSDVPAFELTYTIEEKPEPLVINATPAAGQLTEALTKVTIRCADKEYPFIEIDSVDDIKVTKDGDAWSGVKKEDTPQGVVLTFVKPADESGVYTLTIPASSYHVFNWVGSGEDLTTATRPGEALEFVYDVELGGPRYTLDIPPGRITPKGDADEPYDLQGDPLNLFNFRVSGAETYLIPGSKVRIVSKKNKYDVEGTLRKGTYSQGIAGGTRFYIDVDPAIVQNGTYTMTIPRGVIGDKAYSEDQNTGIANKELVVDLYFTGGEPAPEPTVVYDLGIIRTSPKEGSVDMSSFTWEVTQITVNSAYDIRPGSKVSISGAKGRYEREGELKLAMFTADTRTFKFMNGPEPSINGTYTLTIPQGTFGDAEWVEDPETGHSNPEIKVVWRVYGASGTTADYDIEVASTTPAAEGTADIENSPLEITVTAPGELGVVPGVNATLVNKDANYSGTVKFVSAETVEGNTTFKTEITPAVTVNGTYTLTIPEGLFGDMDYVNDCSEGHGNKAYTMTFDVTGGEAPQEPMKYELIPTVTPANEAEVLIDQMQRLVFVFPEGTDWVDENSARASMSCPEANYFDTSLFRREADADGTFTLTWGTKPFREGVYKLVLKQGIFVNEADNNSNPEITYTWNVKTTGIDSVLSDEEAEYGVYDLNGVYVGDSLKGLPAGLYVVKGRKVIVSNK